MSVAVNMTAITRAMSRAEGPATVRELADLAGITAHAARAALVALERRGEVQKYGVALSGGVCWGVPS